MCDRHVILCKASLEFFNALQSCVLVLGRKEAKEVTEKEAEEEEEEQILEFTFRLLTDRQEWVGIV